MNIGAGVSFSHGPATSRPGNGAENTGRAGAPGQLAKQAVAELKDAGVALPSNIQGKFASGIARGVDMASLIASQIAAPETPEIEVPESGAEDGVEAPAEDGTVPVGESGAEHGAEAPAEDGTVPVGESGSAESVDELDFAPDALDLIATPAGQEGEALSDAEIAALLLAEASEVSEASETSEGPEASEET